MNIDGFGEKLIELLLDKKLIYNIADIYTLTTKQLSHLERMGEKSAMNIVVAINNSKTTNLYRFINGLGINHIGQNASKILCAHFNDDLDLLRNASKDDLININEIGEIMAESIITFFQDEKNILIIEKCLKAGLVFKTSTINKKTMISDKIFVFTGHLNAYPRSKAVEIIEKYGAKSSSSISKNTDFVIAGENAGSKLKKARSLKITILNEIDFIHLLDTLEK